MTDKSMILSIYDERLAVEVDGASYDKAVDMVAGDLADGIEAGRIQRPERTLMEECRDLVRATLRNARRARRNSMRKQLDWIVAALTGNPDEEADMSVVLGQAYMLGDGRDKTLRYWTVEDFVGATMTRYRKAAEATEAATEFDERAQQVIAIMRERGASTLGLTFEPLPA